MLSSDSLCSSGFEPGNLVVSRSVYTGDASTVKVGQKLPPTCPATATCPTGTATNDGTYPNVWNNAKVDASFGVTSPILLDQITTTGTRINTLAVPATVLVTSFPSKSEIGLNLSAEGTLLTFLGYVAPEKALDVSNSNTPGVVDPTNPVGEAYYRAVAQVYQSGAMQISRTNAYNGNLCQSVADPGAPREIGSFSIVQYNDPATGMPYAADKLGKDNNFRGLTIHRNTLYVTKGSGGNGINKVYQVRNAGSLPTAANAAAAPITILPGLPATLAKNADAANPFGIWFANDKTLYVADEGDGTTANAGLQKWILVDGTWQMAYVLQTGLNLGLPYSVDKYPAALNPATDGLRNIAGRNNGDGTVTIWATTSTISASGHQGADPNKLVTVTEVLDNSDPSITQYEPFTNIYSAAYGEVLRGVSFTPVRCFGTATTERPQGKWTGYSHWSLWHSLTAPRVSVGIPALTGGPLV